MFTIKELGDSTSRIGEIQYGSFGIDQHPDAAAHVSLAGGTGIAAVDRHVARAG